MGHLDLTQLPPSYSQLSSASSRVVGGHGYIYDDYAREMPKANAIAARHSAMRLKAQQTRYSKIQSPLYVVVLLALVVFLVQLGTSLTDVPSIRLLEGLICNKYHGISRGKLLPEAQCKVDAVQGELTIITTGALILRYLPGILMAIPYGALADRYGRKSILGLCVLGMILSQLIWIVAAWNWRLWDLRLVCASSAALLLGGGKSVAEAMVFAMVSDVASERRKAMFFQVEICAALLAETVAPFIASEMMKHSVWLPIVLSPAVMTIGGLLVIALPETLELRAKTLKQSCSPPEAPSLSRRSQQYVRVFDLSTPWSRLCDKTSAILRILRTCDVKLLIPTASIATPVATVTMSIILRYIPTRFGWTLMQSGMVLGARTGFSILVLLLIMPSLGCFLSKKQGMNSDLVLARLSVVLLVVGHVIFAAATSITTALVGLGVLTLGTGAPSLCRAALSRLVDSESVGRLYTILAVCEMFGHLACSVGFGALYQIGMVLGLSDKGAPRANGNGGWLALVFYVVAVVYFSCGAMLWIVDAQGEDGQPGDDIESLRSASPKKTEKSELEMRVLVEGK
ncbi:unnamed protein product [Discula destructiva]